MTLKKQSALITGASAGIGASFAVFLANKGFHVFLTARREDRLQALKQEIELQGGTADYITADISQESERIRLFHEVTKAVGHPDILINNAGFGWYGFFTDMEWALAAQMAEVNMRAVIHLTSLFLPGMRKDGRGHVINIGSIAGGLPNQGIALYSASKAFLDAFTTALYRELHGSGVYASVMRLGPVETDFYDHARTLKNGRSIPAERFSISTERVNRALWRLIQRPRRVMYVPGWLAVSKFVENLFGPVIDLIGPVLLKRKSE